MDRTIPFTPMLKENRTNIGKSCNYFAIAMPTMIMILSVDTWYCSILNPRSFNLLLQYYDAVVVDDDDDDETLGQEEFLVNDLHCCVNKSTIHIHTTSTHGSPTLIHEDEEERKKAKRKDTHI